MRDTVLKFPFSERMFHNVNLITWMILLLVVLLYILD